jgi:hypothetical protein
MVRHKKVIKAEIREHDVEQQSNLQQDVSEWSSYMRTALALAITHDGKKGTMNCWRECGDQAILK